MLTLNKIDKELIIDLLKKVNKAVDLTGADKKNLSLMQGLSGLALANFYCGRYLAEPECLAKGEEIVDVIIDTIDKQNYHFINIFSYCNGFAGVCFALNHLQQEGFIALDVTESFAAVEEYIFEIGLKSINVDKSDFLHGGLGIMYYFMQRLPDTKMEVRINEMLSAYIKKGKRDEYGFRIINKLLIDREKDEYDLGMAHGLAGHVVILCELHKLGIQQEMVEALINDQVKYIESKYKDITKTGKNSYYPTSYIESAGKEPENLEFYNTRLAWCYGDLNIALMYLKLGQTFDNPLYRKKGYDVAKQTLLKFDAEADRTTNMFFCHGASGLVSIYLKIYNTTGDKAFLDASKYWENIVIQTGLPQFAELEDRVLPGLIEGGAGVVLSLLNANENSMLGWDKFFLLQS